MLPAYNSFKKKKPLNLLTSGLNFVEDCDTWFYSWGNLSTMRERNLLRTQSLTLTQSAVDLVHQQRCVELYT